MSCVSLLPLVRLGPAGVRYSRSLGQLGSEDAPAGQALLSQSPLKAGLVGKDRVLWLFHTAPFLLPLPEAQGDSSLVFIAGIRLNSWR